jgi:chemotaxis protein histidine kinase CheA
MKNDQGSKKYIRGIVFEELYHLQEGMYKYRKDNDKQKLRTCIKLVFTSIGKSAHDLGFEGISNLSNRILDCCANMRAEEMEKCIEMVEMLNMTIDWMLDQVDPGPGIIFDRDSGSMELQWMLFNYKRMLKAGTPAFA